MIKTIHDAEVHGVDVDVQTRCAHYHSDVDIIAIKFKCCGQWFPCFECHAALAHHLPTIWKIEEHETPAILCGGCGHQLSIREYLAGDSICPKCCRQFNTNCARHYHLYFESPQANRSAFD